VAGKNKKIEILIEDLIQFTRDRKIKWQHVNSDGDISRLLYKILNQRVSFNDGYSVTDNCFYTKINNGYMLVVERSVSTPPGKYYLAVVPNIAGNVFELHDSPQAQIARLHSLLLQTSPVEDYLTGIFKSFRK
jgi:hypothetical protein